ncbi:hypothetical protein M758_UG035600 [Ceratodon purpureus]|nr:hypothetical protein M758_UG035600 [Ceratodon purpureus]
MLMRHLTLGLSLNLPTLHKEATSLFDHTVIASFTDKKISLNAIPEWIPMINRQLGFQGVSFRINMGRGFFFLSTADANVTRSFLLLTPHATPWGSCVYQEWIPRFDPNDPSALRIPTWLNLVQLPHEFKHLEGFIASSLGLVFRADRLNCNLRDPQFCIGIDACNGWPFAISLIGLDSTGYRAPS